MTTEANQALWLDEFPLETRSKLAWYVSSGKQNRDMLSLALTNVYQEQAVVEALSYTYNVDSDTQNVGTQWANVFKNDIRILVANYYPVNGEVSGGALYCHVKPLFSAPTLRELQFHAANRFIGPFLGPCNLRKAVVNIKCESPIWPVAEIALLLRAQDLTIICGGDERCSFFRLGLLAAHYRLFKSVRLHCSCHHSGLWFLLRQVPRVSEICFSANPPPEMYTRIKQIENVRLVFNRNAWDIIPNIPQNVTELGPNIMSVVDQGAILEQCANLRKLDCALKSGTDLAFMDITKNFPSLRAVKLSWAPELTCFLCDHHDSESLDDSHCVTPGAILNLIQHAPNISELELARILVELDELVAILQFLGDRLTKFSCTIRYDGERNFLYLKAVMKALRKYNPRVTAANTRALVFTKNSPFVDALM